MISGTQDKPRLSVFRSNKYISVQAIDDVKRVTLLGLSEKVIKAPKSSTKVERANLVGKAFGKLMRERNIEIAVFDRSGYKYHGRVKALAEGIRDAGIKF